MHVHACGRLPLEVLVRTTVELKDEHRAHLLALAARRGEKGFSKIIEEALDQYFSGEDAMVEQRRKVLALRGSISAEDAEHLRATSREIRDSWR